MRIRWRGLELPSEVERDESACTATFGRFMIEPFERGFGTTVGNSLRRVLLSSLQGAAVSKVKIAGAAHEFMSLPGVVEDVTDIILNIKGLVVKSTADEPKKMILTRATKGVVCGRDIVPDPAIEIIDPDHVIATLSDDVNFEIEMEVRRGRGYVTARENSANESEIGIIPVDSVFSPVVRVRYRTEDTRVGQKTNFDKLILEIWTNGTIAPEDALVEAAKILRKHLNPFVQYHDIGDRFVESTSPKTVQTTQISSELELLLAKPIVDIELSVRANNCLESARIATIGELVGKTESDLLRLRSFGKTSLREIRRKLADLGLSLGMTIEGLDAPSAVQAPAAPQEETVSDTQPTVSPPSPILPEGLSTNPSEVSVPADQN